MTIGDRVAGRGHCGQPRGAIGRLSTSCACPRVSLQYRDVGGLLLLTQVRRLGLGELQFPRVPVAASDISLIPEPSGGNRPLSVSI